MGIYEQGVDVNIGKIDASIISSIAALRLSAITNSSSVLLQHHTTAGDGGGGHFRGVTGAAPGTYVDDNGTIIVPAGGDGSSAWLRDYSGVVDVRWFGASGAGVADDSTAIQSAVDSLANTIYFPTPPVTYKTTKMIMVNANGKRLIGDVHISPTMNTITFSGDAVEYAAINPNGNRVELRNIAISVSGTVPVAGVDSHIGFSNSIIQAVTVTDPSASHIHHGVVVRGQEPTTLLANNNQYGVVCKECEFYGLNTAVYWFGIDSPVNGRANRCSVYGARFTSCSLGVSSWGKGNVIENCTFNVPPAGGKYIYINSSIAQVAINYNYFDNSSSVSQGIFIDTLVPSRAVLVNKNVLSGLTIYDANSSALVYKGTSTEYIDYGYITTQIQFPNGGSTGLKNYKEGTFNLTLADSAGVGNIAISHSFNGAYYTRIGNIVVLTFRWNTLPAGTAIATLSGLPFPISSTSGKGINVINGANSSGLFRSDSTTGFTVIDSTGAGVQLSAIPTIFRGTLTYLTDAP